MDHQNEEWRGKKMGPKIPFTFDVWTLKIDADQLCLDCHVIFPVRNRPCELIPNEGIFVIGQIFAFGMTQEVLMKSRPQNVQKS